MAIAYATSDRGACHQRAWTVNKEILADPPNNHSIEGKDISQDLEWRTAKYELVKSESPVLLLGGFLGLRKFKRPLSVR